MPVVGLFISSSCLTKMAEQSQLNDLLKQNQEMLVRMESLQRMVDDFKVLQRDVEGLKKATTSKTCSGVDVSRCSSSSSDGDCSYPPCRRSRRKKHRSRHSPQARISHSQLRGSGHSSHDRSPLPPPPSHSKGKVPMQSMSWADRMENTSIFTALWACCYFQFT